MKKRMLTAGLSLAVLAAMTALPGPAGASQHFMFIDEVFGGTVAAQDINFVELRMYSGGQTLVDGFTIKTFGNDGSLIDTATFEDNVDNGASGASILVATDEAVDFFSFVPDLEVESLVIQNAGKACFGPAVGTPIDCVTWGNYTGGLGGDVPFNKPEGVVLNASFQRTYGGNDVDSGDDTDNSKNDFRLDNPDPRANDGDTGTAFQRLRFNGSGSAIEVPETAGSVGVFVDREGGATGTVGVDFATSDRSATAGDDYTDADDTMEFADSDVEEEAEIPILDDSEFEGTERILLTLRNPSGGAMLDFPMNLEIRITDYEDDTEKPESKITRPKHGESYARSNLTTIKGTADDGVGDIFGVKMGLRKTLTDGSCRWYNGNGFVQRSCSSKKFVDANGAETWQKNVGLLAKSVGTNVKFYTAFSKAIDSGEPANTESGFETGRNSNRFEIN